MEFFDFMQFGALGVMGWTLFQMWDEIRVTRRFLERILEKELEDTGQFEPVHDYRPPTQPRPPELQ